ncbi:DEAD/DEAH box helicase [Marinisporobacter balticus]|uniref:Superfamily I DNA and/or RNA helicase n=1 Tax=Marinisporobacter balticus TaxID=2018667 RepID=A0A4R2KMY9_9FIRM|nr:ATP-binding protein [Marinisporobacter balticus]TCO72139.1 superfamily I DNA and/or RNA helicase [Marinisporobacter balticus]
MSLQEINKSAIAKKIIEFWYIIEFLSQDPFPKKSKMQEKNAHLAMLMAKNLPMPKGKSKPKKFMVFNKLCTNEEILKIIQNHNEIYNKHQYCSEFIHICYGKIGKEEIVQRLFEVLEIEDTRPEEDKGKLCLFALKIDKNGFYIEDSLRISPMLWGVYRCCIDKNSKDHGITIKNYYDDVRKIESIIEMETELTNKTLNKLYQHIISQYAKKVFKETTCLLEEGILTYSRYDSEKTQNREEGKSLDLSELLNGFYTDDLHMISHSINDKHDSKSMHADIIDYVTALYMKKNKIKDHKKERIDIRANKDYISRILRIKESPLGKWPSKYSPALMQQIAINFGMFNFEGVGNIFSVNGPPGTGKTTLLKEIITHNIVERATLLTKYENPDDAFIKNNYSDGTLRLNGYDEYYPYFYSFKEDKLADYGMLVASNNNAAVENISKELPDAKSLRVNMYSDKLLTENDRQLDEVASMFDVLKALEQEEFFIKLEKEEYGNVRAVYEKKNDIYFSWLAHKLISSESDTETEINAWGLISAPMGKSSNVGRYCYNVLNNIIKSFYNNNDKMKERRNKYKEARINFINQLNIVKDIEDKLFNDSNLKSSHFLAIKKFQDEISSYEFKIAKLEEIITVYNKDINKIQQDISQKEKEYIEIEKDLTNKNDEYSDINNRLEDIDNEISKTQFSIIELEDARKFYEIILHRWIKTERLLLIKEMKAKKNQMIEVYNSNEKKKISVVENIESIKKSKCIIEEEISKLKQILSQMRDKQNNILEEKNNCMKAIQDLTQKISLANSEFMMKLEKMKKDRVILDDDFWKEYFSDVESVSTKAQISNPWTTDKYNREKEKLFHSAIKLHKEFILSSKSCRDNFINLSMMWKNRENSNNELCNFSIRDKDRAFPHLLNTLFLLTPVISTTFASVGRFLKHIKEKESIGLLIVDEAGQAGPHIALGALWRCKKAIIVGDPKQVEPVVTNEADAIKRAFSDQLLKPYMDKTISVQSFADSINKYGSYIKNSANLDSHSEWVGCPLVVHRRCIEPMFSISNIISYGGTMKYQTAAPDISLIDKFILDKSCWLDIKGSEIGNRNHFVNEQGKETMKMIVDSFQKYNGYPNLYVISPFTTVITELKKMILGYDKLIEEYGETVEQWCENCCGTVHKFQGKEANEVIFLLGCDNKAIGAVKWVKPNILNVAVTRAKYRLYIIGDSKLWSKSEIFKTAYQLMQ